MSHANEASDHNLPLLLWQGIEPLVASEASAAISLAQSSRHGILRQFIARRLAVDVSAYQSSRELGGYFLVAATAAPGHTLEELREVIDAEVARVCDGGGSVVTATRQRPCEGTRMSASPPRSIARSRRNDSTVWIPQRSSFGA